MNKLFTSVQIGMGCMNCNMYHNLNDGMQTYLENLPVGVLLKNTFDFNVEWRDFLPERVAAFAVFTFHWPWFVPSFWSTVDGGIYIKRCSRQL